jgi:hypothetical protein
MAKPEEAGLLKTKMDRAEKKLDKTHPQSTPAEPH